MNAVLTILLAVLLARLLLSGLQKLAAHDREELDIVRMPRILLYAGLCFAMFCLSAMVHILRTGAPNLHMLPVVLGLCSACFLLGYGQLRITYDEQQFTVWRWGFKREYHYGSIRGVIPGKNGAYKLVTETTVIPVDSMAVNGDVFLRYAQRRWTVYTGRAILPVIVERR